MEEDKIYHNGVEYTGYRSLSYGDYDGSADVERANVRTMEEEYPDMAEISFTDIEISGSFNGQKEIDSSIDLEGSDVLKVRGELGGRSIYIREESELCQEIGHSLSNYPVLDDEMLSKVQQEMKEEAFHDYGEDDIRRVLEDEDNVHKIKGVELDEFGEVDVYEQYSDEELKAIWDNVVENNPNGDVFEATGFYIDIAKQEDRVIEAANEVKEEKAPSKKKEGPSLGL